MTGKIAIVTGAGQGLGRAIALVLAEEGATVAAVGRTAAKLDKVVEEIRGQGGSAVAIPRDLTEEEQVQSMVDEVMDRFGRIDILVNNAGITRDGLLMKMSEEDFDQVIETNLKGAFHTIRFASRQMLRQKSGRIINLSSVVGVTGNAGQANYAASKAGVIGLTKSAARELASRGITVNAIAPGFIETDMTSVLSEKVKEGAAAGIPLGAFGKPEDVAAAAAFLASDEAGYITGQVLHVDGGMVM